MSYADYRDTVVSEINTKTGLDLVWEDFTLSGIRTVSGATAEVTITPTTQGSAKFKGTAKFLITRMDLSNKTYVFWRRGQMGDIVLNTDLRYMDEDISTQTELMALLELTSGQEFLLEDFVPTSVTVDPVYETAVVLTAKPDSYYYYGNLNIKLVHAKRTRAIMDVSPVADVAITSALVGGGSVFVDDVLVTLPYTLPGGSTYKVAVWDFTTITNGFAFLTPTRLRECCLYFTGFNYLFQNCIKLTKVDEESVYLDGGIFNGLFRNCSGLLTLPSSLFRSGSTVSTMDNFFEGIGVTTIPVGLFKNLSGVTSLNATFNNCPNLKSIPGKLLDPLGPTVISAGQLFSNCPLLSAIPFGLLDKFTNCTYFLNLFINDKALKDIPGTLFDLCTSLTNITGVFQNCSGITAIPTGLLTLAVKLTIANDVFNGCSGITTIPSTLLATCTTLVQISGLFMGTSITGISSTLLVNQTKIVWAERLFSNCKLLTAIPESLFNTCVSLTRASSLFESCIKVTELPPLLLANNPNLSYVDYAFSQLGGPITIPAGFFPGNKLNSIVGVFFNSRVVSIPAQLFAAHTTITFAAKAFAQTDIVVAPTKLLVATGSSIQTLDELFRDCKRLTTVEAYCVEFVATTLSGKSTTIASLFEGCTDLTTLAVNAVRGSGLITRIDKLCLNCVGLKYSVAEITARIALVTSSLVSNTSHTFSAVSAFEGCRQLTGTCDALWTYYNNSPLTNVRRTYTNFIEKDFLLTDYTAVGKPWWSTPIDLNVGLIQPVPWVIDDYVLEGNKPAGYDHIPLYVSFNGTFGDYISTIRNIPSVANYPVASYALSFMQLAAFMGVTFKESETYTAIRITPSAANGLNTAYTGAFIFNFEGLPISTTAPFELYNYVVHYTR